jgi:hypothetical protein
MSPLRNGVVASTADALPVIDGGAKVIRFRARDAASSQSAAARACAPGVESEVIRFRPRRAAARHEFAPGSWDAMDDSPVADLRKYEHAVEDDDDYRRRMRVNVLAAVVLVGLMVAGDWIVSALAATTRESQNCYRPGASNCAATYMPRQHG